MRGVSIFCTKLEEIVLRGRGNFVEQNEALESPTNILYYSLVISNAANNWCTLISVQRYTRDAVQRRAEPKTENECVV